MLIPELVRKDIVFILPLNEKGLLENDPAKENLEKKQSACDLHQAAAALQSSCTDVNHKSTAIKVLLIAIGLTDLYLDMFSVICKTCNIKKHC